MRLNYANIAATLALVLSCTGTAVAGVDLITGAEVKDGSLTGADVRNASLSGLDIKDGSVSSKAFSLEARSNLRGLQGSAGPQGATGATGAAGPQGAAGLGTLTTTITGSDVTGYQDDAPLATGALASAGDYVIFSNLTVHNTGANNEDLSCGFNVNGDNQGAGGVSTTAGATTPGTMVGVATTRIAAGSITFFCRGGGATTYDISDVKMRIHFLG